MKFIDLLRSGSEFQCDLIIGDSDMPASFVWHKDSKITEYGYRKFQPIFDADCRILMNGNIEILCDDWRMGEEFCWAQAGEIELKEYDRIFGTDDGK